MDLSAIVAASDEDLSNLGLIRRGDILALRAFCSKNNASYETQAETKKSLIYQIKNNGRTLKTKSEEKKCKRRICHFGIMLYNTSKKRYIQYRGSGVREGKFQSNATKADLVQFSKGKFFQDGKHSKLGRISQYIYDLGNSEGDVIPY